MLKALLAAEELKVRRLDLALDRKLGSHRCASRKPQGFDAINSEILQSALSLIARAPACCADLRVVHGRLSLVRHEQPDWCRDRSSCRYADCGNNPPLGSRMRPQTLGLCGADGKETPVPLQSLPGYSTLVEHAVERLQQL